MKKQTTKRIIYIAIGIIFVLLLIRVVFDKKFDNFNDYIKARDSYEGGTEEFDKNFEKMTQWIDEYKSNNPDASDEDANAAFEASFR